MEDTALLCPEKGPCLVFTVDFITPIVDEPETFGAIAAANAMSDVYAMGGEPQVALAVCGFPTDKLPREILERILRGGRDKAAEAGCAVVGGHTVRDPELKYGLCVVGAVDPGRVLTHERAREGDRLVLTKPLGCGIASQAIKNGELPPDSVRRVTELMLALNREAKDAALAAGARAATDVTGFGLLGHLHHMLLGPGLTARVYAGGVPVLDFARGLAERGLVPGGTRNNLAYAEKFCRWGDDLAEVQRLLLADAQTSGGLLISVPAARTAELVRALADRGTPARAVIGELLAGEPGRIEIFAGSAPS